MNYDKWEHFFYKHPLIKYAVEMGVIGLIILAFVLLGIMCIGCGSAEAKTDIPVSIPTEQIDKNTADIKGNANKIETNSVKISTVETTVNSSNEALERSFKNEIATVKGDINSVQKNVTNSMWYAFGVLIIIGAVGLIGLVIVLYFYRGFKGFGRT